MTENSPEELIAEALRAKAGQTGGNASVVADELPSGRTARSTGADQQSSVESNIPDISLGWVAVLAVLLGVATGALIGLLTVI
ncbi:MAG: hypothetical protein GEU97_12890 [Actinophytocola sp.]|nr:hypothetical protein [Actinophytocola sp.]